ncbi:hypothetical protein SY94_5405 (plasmid) [Agrobacterium tumefaciens]|nr:hypothetical protein SY94_5405 [Agrobacterium tumefaciens]
MGSPCRLPLILQSTVGFYDVPRATGGSRQPDHGTLQLAARRVNMTKVSALAQNSGAADGRNANFWTAPIRAVACYRSKRVASRRYPGPETTKIVQPFRMPGRWATTIYQSAF